jgi:hypothetical protein
MGIEAGPEGPCKEMHRKYLKKCRLQTSKHQIARGFNYARMYAAGEYVLRYKTNNSENVDMTIFDYV